MIPDIPNPYSEYPFSLSFLVQCFSRCLLRPEHETLTNEDPTHLAQILFLFFKFYFRQKFDSHFLKFNQFDDYLKISFTYEHQDLELPSKLVKCIERGLDETKSSVPDGEPHPAFVQFVELINIYKQVFGGVPSGALNAKVHNALNHQFSSLYNIDSKSVKIEAPLKEEKKYQRKVVKVEESQPLLTTRREEPVREVRKTEDSNGHRAASKEVVRQVSKQEPTQETQRKKETPKEEKKEYKEYKPRVVTSSNTNDFGAGNDFQVTQKRQVNQFKKKSKNQIPYYQAISLMDDPDLDHNLRLLLIDGLDPLK